MYQTIKARIDHGHILPLESTPFPVSADVLVTILLNRSNQESQEAGAISKLMDNPLKTKQFKPLTRDEIHSRGR